MFHRWKPPPPQLLSLSWSRCGIMGVKSIVDIYSYFFCLFSFCFFWSWENDPHLVNRRHCWWVFDCVVARMLHTFNVFCWWVSSWRCWGCLNINNKQTAMQKYHSFYLYFLFYFMIFCLIQVFMIFSSYLYPIALLSSPFLKQQLTNSKLSLSFLSK